MFRFQIHYEFKEKHYFLLSFLGKKFFDEHFQACSFILQLFVNTITIPSLMV